MKLDSPYQVVHLTSAHPPYDVRIFIKESISLAREGFALTLIAPHDNYETVENVEIVPVRKACRFRRMTITVAEVYRKARILDADIYHFHDHELIPVGLLLRVQGKRVIYDIHEDMPRALFSASRDYLPGWLKPLVSKVAERLENYASRCFSALVAATPAIAGRFRPLNVHTVVVNNYPRVNELLPPAPIAWTARQLAVAYVGGLTLERGAVQMVDAMACLPTTLPAKLHLVGSFASGSTRQAMVYRPGWEHVQEHGVLDRAKVAKVLNSVRVGLVLYHPDPNHIQAQPHKLFEYMSVGLPVVASDFPLWRRLINEVGCGITVNPQEPNAIAEAVEFLLTHPNEAEAMGRLGRKAVKEQFNWESEASKLIQLYADLLSSV